MKRNVAVFVLTVLLTTFAFSVSLWGQGDQIPTIKRTVAIFTFEDKSGHQVHWGHPGQNLGNGMSDIFTTYLYESGKCRIIERQQLDQVLKEQGMGASDILDPTTAAKIGKILGVDAGIIGAVTEFAYVQTEKELGWGPAKVTIIEDEAIVGINIRAIDINTGEIIAVAESRKKKKKKGIGLGYEDKILKSKSAFDESIAGEATREVMSEIVKEIIPQLNKLPWKTEIAKADESGVIIRAGSKVGLKAGDVLAVYRVEMLVEPDIFEETKVGKIKVVKDLGEGKASRCEVVEGENIQKGDIAKVK